MKIHRIIQELRAHCPFFFDQSTGKSYVAGALSFEPLLTVANLPVPCAYVILDDDQPEEQYSGQAYRQTVRESFSVAVCLANTSDPRGQTAADVVHDVRQDLLAVLAGYVMDDEYSPLEYAGSTLEHFDAERVFYSFKFVANYEITKEQTRQWGDYAGDPAHDVVGMPAYTGADINVDYLDPQVDTNRPSASFPADPAAYEGGVIGQKPDGRIEGRFSIDPID